MKNLMLAGLDRSLTDELVPLLSERYRLHICTYGPDVLLEFGALLPELLVIDLNMAGCDTVSLLRAVQARGGETQVLTLACSYFCQIQELLSMVDTAFLLIHPLSAHTIVTRLQQLEQLLPKTAARTDPEEILEHMGLDCHSAGFPSLCQAIVYKCDHPQCLYSGDLCVHVANCRGGTALSVDKAMTRCIRKAWRRRDPTLWAHYLGGDFPDITCARFINALAAYITHRRGVEKCI